MQHAIETNKVDPATLDIASTLEKAQQDLLKIEEEMQAFRKGRCSFKNITAFEERIIEKLDFAPDVQKAIHVQLSKDDAKYVIYKQEASSIKHDFLKAKEEVTARRKELEQKMRFDCLGFVVGTVAIPAAAENLLKGWLPPEAVAVIQLSIAAFTAFHTTKDYRKALYERVLENPKTKSAQRIFRKKAENSNDPSP
ncbi:MAG: hypothetical protein FWF24_07165 [Alphaproteobacteria bacterium]|nr:hypothetical protein [Alphaproteobacteria bacterium]